MCAALTKQTYALLPHTTTRQCAAPCYSNYLACINECRYFCKMSLVSTKKTCLIMSYST